jgi:hypothetical protein
LLTVAFVQIYKLDRSHYTSDHPNN